MSTYFIEFYEGLDRGCYGMRHVGTRSLRASSLEDAKVEARDLMNRCPTNVQSVGIWLVEDTKYVCSLQRGPYIAPRPGHGRLDVTVGRSFGGEWPGPSK